jgi:spermidine synthase
LLYNAAVDRTKSALYALFFFSGISGLIYETIWLRMLIRVLGCTAYATAVMLAAFMAGMALGSYLLGRYAADFPNKLRLYALLELGVGITALALTFSLNHLVPLYRLIYGLVHGGRFGLTIFQSVLMFAVLLVPTSLMGGTLPVLSAHTKSHQLSFPRRIGLLYGLNTLGAVVGVLWSGLFSIGALGETATLYIGLVITLAVAWLAFRMSLQDQPAAAEAQAPRSDAGPAISAYSLPTRRLVGVAYLLSGFTAMAYEIVWTRMFQIELGTSIYAFSIMLAFYLAGVATGSLCARQLVGKAEHPLQMFGLAQLGVGLYGLIGMYLVSFFEPVSLSLQLSLKHVLVMPFVVVFPITFVLGVIFPAVCRCYVASEAEVSRAVGRLYALNTLGCILGSLVCGFVLVWLLGTRGTVLVLAGINLTLGVVLVFRESAGIRQSYLWPAAATVVMAAVVLGFASPDPFTAAVQRAIRQSFGRSAKEVKIYFQKEGIAATTTALGIPNQPSSEHLWVNGIGMTIPCTETKIMAHLPLLLHQNPKEMLIVCFGMGTTVRSARVHKQIQCDVVELVPEVYDCLPYFHADGPAILSDPRIHRYADDGRNFLLMRSKQYDVITMDPPPPVWSAGTVNLYTEEFFDLCHRHLNPDGIMCLWVPPMEASEARMIMKTFNTVFPDTYVWRSSSFEVPGFFLVGLKDHRELDPSPFRAANENKEIVADLSEWGPFKPGDIIKLFTLTPEQLALYVDKDRIISDDHPYTEFPLWRSLFDKAYHTHIEVSSSLAQNR